MRHHFMKLRRCLVLASLTGVALALPGVAYASWPDRPIKLVVPYAPGGATDVIGRIVAQRLSVSLGQQVIVENRGGAGGNIGADAVAKARPDGYTLLMAAMTSHSTIATLEKGRLKYDILKDLSAIQVIGYVPLVFVTNPSVPVTTFQQLIEYTKSNPTKISYASSGPGAPQRMAVEMFRKRVGVDLVHVAYKGSGPAMTDLVGGQVQLMAETVPAALQMIKAGKLRALAVTTPQKVSMLAEVPTVAESGWSDFEVVSTFGVMAPAGTPAEVMSRLNLELGKIMQDPEAKAQFLQQGVFTLPPMTEQQASARLNIEVSKWAAVIHEAGIKAED